MISKLFWWTMFDRQIKHFSNILLGAIFWVDCNLEQCLHMNLNEQKEIWINWIIYENIIDKNRKPIGIKKLHKTGSENNWHMKMSTLSNGIKIKPTSTWIFYAMESKWEPYQNNQFIQWNENETDLNMCLLSCRIKMTVISK